jgi:hypothetical protein
MRDGLIRVTHSERVRHMLAKKEKGFAMCRVAKDNKVRAADGEVTIRIAGTVSRESDDVSLGGVGQLERVAAWAAI